MIFIAFLLEEETKCPWSRGLYVVQKKKKNRSLVACSTLAMKLRVLHSSLTNILEQGVGRVGRGWNTELVTKVHLKSSECL